MKTSIVVVSYNRKDLLNRCLRAITKFAPKDSETIVVDNGSTEDIPGLVRKNFPKIKLIALKTNTGFANGNNVGILASHGEYLLLVNTDAFMEKDVTEVLEKFLDTHPDIGAVGPQLKNVDGSIQVSGGYFPHLFQAFLLITFIDNIPLLRHFTPSIHIRDVNYFTFTRPMEWIMGAFIMVRRSVFDQTGGFDENIFMYGEELEWCYRIRKAGWKIYLNSDVHVTHLGHSSSPSERYGIIKEMESFLSFYRKHKPKWQLPILVLLMTLGCLLRIIRGVITFKPMIIITYVSALKTIYFDLFKTYEYIDKN